MTTMYKSKRQVNKKSFDWYGLSQRFSIRKYHFGAASVLLGTALILGSPQATAKADDTVSTPTTQTSSEQGPDAGSSSTTDSLKNVTLPTTASTTEATVLEKPELSAEEIAKATSSETTAATTEKAKEESKPAASDAVVKTNAEEKAKTDKLTEKTEKETKAEEKAEKKEDTASQKTILTQLTSEAEVLNTTAANYAEKKVEDKSSKEAIAAAVAAAKVEIAASKKVLEAENVTKAELDAQLQRISSAIEAVYAEMKRGGHIGKVEAVLPDVSSTVKNPERTRIRNLGELTDEEVAEIIRQVRIANPNLTAQDRVEVVKKAGAYEAGKVTITYANGDTATISSAETVLGAGVARNVEALKDAINWFEFSSATIVYPDGTEAGPARYMNTEKKIMVDDPIGDGTKVEGNLRIVRDIKYADGTTGLSTDDRFLKSGIAEFTMHRNYYNQYINNREVYEVLKEGMVLKVPTRVKGYNLTLRVEKLAPKPVATDPNTTATRGKNAMRSSEGSTEQFKPVKMILQTRDGYSYLNSAGVAINDPSGRPALSSISANRDGANVGITFSASATYNGQPVPVNLVAVDGEEATRGEFYQVETNGSNWKELMSLNLNERQVTPQNGYTLGQDYSAITAGNLDFYGYYKRDGYNSNEWVNKIQDTDSSGNLRYDKSGNPVMKETVFGTKYFGPAWTAKAQGHALPIGFSEGVSEFSMYINSNGSQAGTIGFVVFDGGDAPQSYGSAQHVIGNINKVNSSGQQVVATQPHFGTEPGDPDFRSTSTDPAGAWTLDDLIHTNGYKVINMHEGSAVTNEAGDTGTYKLLDVNGRKTPVLLKADGSTVALKTGEILKINNPEDNFLVQGIFDVASQGVGVGTLPDEGKGQLLDPAVASDYKLRQATDNEYVLDGIKVNSGENNDVAYARGWVDFNNNGKFDDGESSEVVEVRGKQTVSFKFKRTPQLLNTSIDSVGIRLRIALDKKEILSPTGLASSGEVEDFQTHVIHPPRGTENSTQDLQGKPQKLDINTTDLFTATGKTEASKYATWNQMDNTVAPKFVVTESVVASETATGNTVNIVDATGNTVYNGTEVTIRDARGNTLGTAVKVTNPLNGTTEYLLSEYTEYDTAGNLVGTYTLNKENNGLNKAGANGIYRTTIDFKPALAYVGTAKGVAIRAWDQNRISTGWNASDKTIEESKKNITLADKDKILKNTNENVNGRYSMDSTYIPTVIDVRPVGEDTVTEDVQGKPQFATPKIPAYGTVETVTGDKITDVKYTSDYVILDKNVKPRFAQTFENRKGKYEQDTPVSTSTTLTLEDGRVVTYKPDTEKIPASTKIAETSSIEVSGTGVVVDNVRVTSGTLPAGASPQADHPVTTPTDVILSDGTESTIPAGGKIPRGAKLKNAYVSKVTNTWNNVTYNTGDTIPQASYGKVPVLKEDTAASQIVATGKVAKIDNQYIANGIIPAGTKVKKVLPFNEVVLPKAIHIDPTTGAISEVARRYDLANTNETKVTIIGEGVYELNQTTGEVKFTPEPGFVGTGTGVDLEQPDIDYNNKVAGDSVTSKYGTDYGRARYTPIVTPKTSASITRTIHYVYENDNDNPGSSDSYKDNKEILAINGEPVVTKQTLNYTRTYKIFEEDGVLETATRSAVPVTDVTGRTYAVGEEIPAGTKFAQGKIIISEWKAGDQNSVMRQVISPTVKGYTANVVTAANAQGKMGHIHNNKQPVGLYTPVTDNTRDVGEYEPLVSEVTSDTTDDFDMYVVYKRDTQKANVVYIDLDEKGDKRVLEIQSGLTEADLTAANKQKDAKTEYNVADLRGKSDTKIPYDTAATIKKYTDKGYELASDDYKNDENGNVLANGRNFDEDSTNDQTFYVYLRHKKEQLSKNDVRTVTRHIEYKYADTVEVPADKRGQAVETTLAKKVTEVLTFERTRTIDMAATAKLYETQYNAYKSVAANNAVGSDAEVEARATLFKYVEDKAKEAGATDEAKAVISYGEWQAKPGQATNLTLSAAEENIKDSKFNDVVSPTVPGYLPDNAKVEATADVNPESDPKEYTVTVTYSPGDQKAIVNFVEVDANDSNQVITPGLADPVTITGKSGAAFPTTASSSVQAKIDELVKKGYELVDNGNGFVATDSFDTNADVDQTYTVKLRAKTAPVVPTDNVTPVPGQPVDPNNPTGPKWPESVKNLVNKDTVKRTIKYVYEDGTPVIDPATGAQKVVEQTAEFTRTANVNLVTGDITYGAWTPAEGTDLVAVTSPTSTDIPAVAKYVPSTATVPVVKVQAGQDDITETVVYRKANPVTVQPNDPTPTKDQPIDPNNTDPNAPKWTEDLLKKLEDARKEEVTRTITYKYSDVATDLKADDAAKAGTDVKENVTVTNTVTFKRPVTIDPQTGEFSYGDWVATNGTTLAGKADLPAVAGYVATGDVEASKKDVTDVKATDKDITDKVVYKALGKFVPVVPEGFTPPTIENPQYPNNNDDPSKPGTPTTTIPYVPGTTPIGPDGQPLTPKNGDKTQGYLPPTPTTPTGDTTITYVKDGTQIAVTKFVDTTGKGLEPSVVDTGDTGKAFTKDADVTAAINKILARGYEKVANVNAGEKDYPSTDAEKVFDADAKTNQEFTVTFKPKELPADPTKPVDPNNNPVDPTDPASPNKPRDPETTVTPKPTDPVPNDPKGRTYGELGLVEQVTRTIRYVYEDGSPVEAEKLETVKAQQSTTLTFTRKAKINAVTGEVTYLQADGTTPATAENPGWTATNGSEFVTVKSPTIENYTAAVAGVTPTTDTVPAKTVTATDKDFEEVVVYKKIKPVTITPNTDVPDPEDPNTPADNPIQPNKPIDPNNPEGPKWTKELIDKLRDARSETVTRTITYKYSTETSELKAEDAAKAGQTAADTVTNTVTFKRPVTIDPVTKEFTYGDWVADNNDTTLEGKADLPVVAGYVATGDVEASKKDVTDVKATDKDITENVVYKTVGKYVPVIPDGITPPANTNVDPKPYNNDPQDGSKVKDPDPTNPVVPGTTTPIVPQIPGTTPVGSDGKPLKPVDSNDLSKGYVPPTPTDPTKDTSIIYVKDGSQVAVVHFVDEKGNSVNESVVETGDTGNTISTTKADAVKQALEAKGYEVVAPTDALYTADKEGFYKEADRKFDAVSDKATGVAGEKVPSQQYYVIVKGKERPVDPTKPLDPNNNPVDPTNPTPENPTKPRDPETPVTPKPEDKVPNDPKGRTYGELGLVEEVTRTINYVKNDGSKAAEPVKETLTFTRKAKINAVTGEVTYLDNDGNATTKEAAPWTPANNDSTFDKVTSPSVPDYTPTRAEVPAKENVTATDEDIVETVVYNPTKQTVDPNAPKDPSTPDVTPKPNDVVPNDPKGRTYKELGLIEEVTRTVHYVYEDGTKAAEDKVQTITFTRTAEIDTVTGAISNFGTWTLKDENNTFEPETTEAKDGYIASAAKSTEVTGVQATDKDTEETIIYRKLGSYVPVVPAGVTPPADFDKTPKPYPNATPEDPTRPGTPTTPTTTIPEIPGTTPVGPDGTPLTKNPNGGYDLPPVPTDPTQNTTITYVKDGSQVAVVHFVDEKGNSVNESVVETGDTGKEISKSNVDKVKAALEAKGYTVVEPTDALYTTDKEGFYKEATRTFDAVSDKSTGAAGEKVPSQQYYVIVKAKDLPVDPTKPLDPNNNPVDPTNPTPENPTKPRDPETPVTPKPEDKVPNDPKGRTYGELGLVEEVTRTINYVKNDGSKAAEPVKETLTFTRKAKINAVTGEVTYLDNDGNATTKEAAPWTPVNNDTTFDKVTSPSVPDYTPTKAEVPAKENVTATDEDIVETVVYNPTKVTVTPNDPNVDPEKPLNPNDPNGLKYKDLKLTEEVKRTITYTYADDVADTSKRGTDAAPKHETTVSFTRTATVNQATGEVTYGDWTAVNNDTTLEGKTELPVIPGYVATGDVESVKKDVANVSATDKDIVEKVVYKDLGKYVPVVPEGTTPPSITDPKYPNNPTDPTKPGEPTTTIPPVDGLTPLDPSTGKPLEPKDPNDLSKGYKPPVPQDPSKDTNIVYVKDGSQVTVVHFVDEDGNAVHTSFVEAGDAGAKFTKAGEVTKVVEELKAAGYTVVPNKVGQAEYPGEAGVFDSVDDKGKDGVSQVYYVTVAKTVPVTPTTPENPNEDPKNPKPGDPIDPNKPDGPKWTEDALNKLNNIKSVTRTITYVKDGTDEEVSTTEAPKVTNKVSFTRTAIVNPKDGSVVGYDTNGDGKVDLPATDTTNGWTAAGTAKFAEVKSPVVKGYVVKPNQDTQGDLVEADGSKVKASATNLTVDSPNQDLKVRYVPVGTWTPKVPDGETPIDPIPYPNDPKDPGKVVDPNKPTDPNDPNKPSVPVVPHIPGTTPKDPNGNPLKPVDPTDPSKGYVPPTPKTPTENTEIKYEKDTQKAIVKYVVEGTTKVLHKEELTGDSGTTINYTTANKLAELKVLGYELVTDGFTTATDKSFDKDTKVDQNFVVTVKPKVVDVPPFDPTNPNDPNTPKPGQPIDPENPNGPKWTEELIKSLDTTKHVNRTISYVKEDGSKVEYLDKDGNKSTADVTDKVTFTRDLKVNVVTGKIVDPNVAWTSKDTTFDAVKSPVAPGYVLKDATQKVVAETTGLTENSKDETIKVVYVPVGTWVPNVPKGETPIDPIPYPNDPKDPGKVVDPNDPTNPNDPNKPSVPVIPHIPGTTPKDPNGNPLKPVDPEDPTKGYVPPTPTTPTENTEINYEKDTQKAVTKFVDPSRNPIPGVTNIEETGKSGEPLTKATEVTTEIAKLIAKGYDLVSNNYGKDNNGNFDKDSGKDQEYTVVLIPHVEPIKPFDPTNPDDPNTPKPGQPIDPNNPDGPKWTEELINKLETTKHVTRKITYVEDGTDKEVADKATDKVTFTREAKINVVTGTIEYGKWTPVNNDTTFDKVTSPVVPGYVLKDPSQKEVDETTGLTENSKDETIKVVYVPVGKLVPKVPEGVTPPTPTPYDNDPQDPGKVVPPSPTKPTDPQDPNSPKVPVIPHIPGTKPKVPQDPTKPVDPNTNPLVPLKPVDPTDPSKGYEVPPVPTDPGTDTPIVYENDKQKAITNFVDNNGKVVSDPVVDQGDSGSKFTKSGDVESKIKELVKKGYVVTSNDYPSADTDRVFDNDKDKDQIFNVKVTPLIVPTDPNSPDQPQVPTDPTKPVGPNNPLKPVTPSTPEPGKPVFPEDPNSPVWPETVKDMVTETTATRTITYVDRNGKEVAATHTETIKFKRTAKVNLVTGDITYGGWTVVGDDTILDGNKLPKVDGYIARGGDIESSQKDIEAKPGVNITETVVYDKLGSWIPKLPEGQTQVPPTPYPNDPTDPTKPGTDKPRVPYVPGFIPVDPNGNPLKPVDPNDPTKGYEVPDVPADPTQDTPIKYIPVPKPNNGGGNNGGGGGNTPTPQPQPNPTPQPEPSPAPNPVPVTPETPEQPVVPVAPEQPAEPATPQYMDGQRELPNTGTEAHSSLAALGLLGALSGFGLIARKKRKDEE